MDRRRIELQLRLIMVTYRAEEGRRNISAMREFRARARSLLRDLEPEVRPYPDLQSALAEVRRELDQHARDQKRG